MRVSKAMLRVEKPWTDVKQVAASFFQSSWQCCLLYFAARIQVYRKFPGSPEVGLSTRGKSDVTLQSLCWKCVPPVGGQQIKWKRSPWWLPTTGSTGKTTKGVHPQTGRAFVLAQVETRGFLVISQECRSWKSGWALSASGP